ncbi:MAG: rhomboid family intramembrane serine protease [Leptospiraceae bacterium]|nr:rhomboid family intramembrane serine protease [Leptospiraceae bacterium]MCK6381110.1 rhomboid family intramembrane serine protease [Leptospiraceae bacterium]NUM42033.1 rhomboid family intramembrane serine protease [Leptospiraceae bacterium]
MSKRRSISPTLFGFSIFHPLNLILFFNCFIFILQQFANQQLIYKFALIPELILRGNYWQIFTYGFLHATESMFPFHLLMNMYGFYMLGSTLEPVIGKLKLTLLYFASQIGGGLVVLLFAVLDMNFMPHNEGGIPVSVIPTIGASGAVFGLLAVFGILFPEMELYLLFFRIQAKNAVWISLLIGLAIEFFFSSPVSNSCHLGGAITGFLFYRFFLKDDTVKANKAEQQLKKVIHRIQKIQDHKPDPFEKQIQTNRSTLKNVDSLTSYQEKEELLNPLQIQNANICPPPTYNREDNYCQRCEWLPNCELRKIKDDRKEDS